MMRNVLFVLLLATGCGGDKGVTGPTIRDVSGSWHYAMTNLTGPGVPGSCSTNSFLLSLSQQGASFSGSYSAATISCNGTPVTGTFSGTVVSGSVSGDAVSFDFDTADWRNTGTVSGSSMSGTATVRVLVGTTTYILMGPWAAAR